MKDIEHEWDTIWEVFPELSENTIGEPATIPPPSSSTISSTISHTSIPSTTLHTPSSVSHTANSHTHCHTIEHLHHTNTITPTKTTTPTTSSITTLTPIISPKQPRRKKTKDPTTTILPNNTSAQITIPKRKPPTLSPFISTDFRLKQRKKYPLPFTHHRTSLTTRPTTHSTTSSTTPTTKTAPNTKISTTATQSTSNTPIHNIPTTPTTPTHATLTTVSTTTINTTTTNRITSIATINTTTTNNTTATTTTTRQTHIPSLMDLDISLPPRLRTPSLPLTIPLVSSPPHSLIFPRTLQELQQSGLWGTLVPDVQQRPKEVTITWQF